jgi:hypothetical protein
LTNDLDKVTRCRDFRWPPCPSMDPPAASVEELLRFVSELTERPLPPRIDAAFLKARGLEHPGNLHALQFLSLVMKDCQPTGVLHLIGGQKGASLAQDLWQWSVVAYFPHLFGHDPSFCTKEELSICFGAHRSGHPDNVDAAVAFYLELRKSVGPGRGIITPTASVESERISKPMSEQTQPGCDTFQIPIGTARNATLHLPHPFDARDIDAVYAAVAMLRQTCR